MHPTKSFSHCQAWSLLLVAY